MPIKASEAEFFLIKHKITLAMPDWKDRRRGWQGQTQHYTTQHNIALHSGHKSWNLLCKQQPRSV